MDKQDVGKSVSRRDVLRLAGTAAAFCTSFGFLHGGGIDGQAQIKGETQHKIAQIKWQQASIKWYAGSTLLHSAAIPTRVAKHLAADANAVVELKLFEAGRFLKNLGTIQHK